MPQRVFSVRIWTIVVANVVSSVACDYMFLTILTIGRRVVVTNVVSYMACDYMFLTVLTIGGRVGRRRQCCEFCGL